MFYDYEQGKIDGDMTQEKFGNTFPMWIDLNKEIKDGYAGADFWFPKEVRENIEFGPKLELKLRRGNGSKVDPYCRQLHESSILAVEFDEDGEYHFWYMKDFLIQSDTHSCKKAAARGRRQMTRKKFLAGELNMSLDEIVNTLDPSQFVRDPRPATLLHAFS